MNLFSSKINYLIQLQNTDTDFLTNNISQVFPKTHKYFLSLSLLILSLIFFYFCLVLQCMNSSLFIDEERLPFPKVCHNLSLKLGHQFP